METIPAKNDIRIVTRWDDFFADDEYYLLERRKGLGRFLYGEWQVRSNTIFYSIALKWSERYKVEIEK